MACGKNVEERCKKRGVKGVKVCSEACARVDRKPLQSDLLNHCAIVQLEPRLYDSAMATQITLLPITCHASAWNARYFEQLVVLRLQPGAFLLALACSRARPSSLRGPYHDFNWPGLGRGPGVLEPPQQSRRGVRLAKLESVPQPRQLLAQDQAKLL